MCSGIPSGPRRCGGLMYGSIQGGLAGLSSEDYFEEWIHGPIEDRDPAGGVRKIIDLLRRWPG